HLPSLAQGSDIRPKKKLIFFFRAGGTPSGPALPNAGAGECDWTRPPRPACSLLGRLGAPAGRAPASARQLDGVTQPFREDRPEAVPEVLSGLGVEPPASVRVRGEMPRGEVCRDPDLPRRRMAVDHHLGPLV